MVTPEMAKDKWMKKLAANVDKWATMVSKSSSYDQYVSRIADFLGVSESEVRGSTAASMWKDFQGRADELKSLLAEIADEEHADRWFSNLRTAFTT